MNKLPIFKENNVKSFKFTLEQYVNLEIEFNRYTIYKEMITNIENILKLNENSNEYSNRKLYENKNIIERFVLECINHGLTPKLNSILLTNRINNVYVFPDSIDNDLEIIEALYTNLFFNKYLTNVDELRKCIYFQKMLNEYNEKKIKLTLERVNRIEKTIIDAQIKFIGINKMLVINKNKPGYFNNINCSIYVSTDENYIIKYKNYNKVINFNRYARLVCNYDRPFPYDIIRMILRYSIFDTSNQQWSIGNNLYEHISNLFDISFEMFASPLNFNMNMFCSIFLDTDKLFGSMGSFYNLSIEKILNQNIKGVFFNPPYLPILMNYTTKICINLLEKMDKLNIDFTIISFLPAWNDAEYIQNFITSNYTMFYKIIHKGNYVLQEKDKGKIIKGTFDLIIIIMNSKKATITPERLDYMTTSFNNIITIMKDETYTNQ
jgi:hypothetical protein